MALSVLGVFLGLLLEVSAHGPSSVPRTSWRHEGTKPLCLYAFIVSECGVGHRIQREMQ